MVEFYCLYYTNNEEINVASEWYYRKYEDPNFTKKPGIQGPPGLTGPDGQRGPKGEVGIVGTTGFKGLHGPDGDKGKTGNKGEKGNNGERGSKGWAGSDGLPGPAGPSGKPGINGAQGAQGLPGTAGHKGVVGNQGAKGAKGNTGVLVSIRRRTRSDDSIVMQRQDENNDRNEDDEDEELFSDGEYIIRDEMDESISPTQHKFILTFKSHLNKLGQYKLVIQPENSPAFDRIWQVRYDADDGPAEIKKLTPSNYDYYNTISNIIRCHNMSRSFSCDWNSMCYDYSHQKII
ncbi:hypothetical protein HZS_4923, partial [Henneguya salminicola]